MTSPFEFNFSEQFIKVVKESTKFQPFSKVIDTRKPLIDFSKMIVKLPKFDFPDINLRYEEIEKLAENNSKFGWTLTGEMDSNFYLDEDLLGKDQEFIDGKFVEYYEKNNQAQFKDTTEEILYYIEDKWTGVLVDCFTLYNSESYRIIIPFLITVIEGELSNILESELFGKRLLKSWEKEILSNDDKFIAIASYSLQKYLYNTTFENHDFNEERRSSLNRNWVLHGRDDPNLWTRTDALKLINIISTLQFIKDEDTA